MGNKNQTQIPGTERQELPEVEEKSENYRLIRDQRMALADKEKAAKTELIQTMEAHNVSVHRYDDQDGIERRVVLEKKTNAKVGKVRASRDDEGTTEVDVS